MSFNSLSIHSNPSLLDAIQTIGYQSSISYIPQKLIALDDQISHLKSLLDITIKEKSSSAILLTGRKSSGKTTLLKYCLQQYDPSLFAVVYLTSYFHFSETYELSLIAAQLGISLPKEKNFQESIGYLEAYLGKQQSELQQYQQQHHGHNKRQETIGGKPVFIVIEDFEAMFGQSSKQNLLYKLLDLSHYQGLCLTIIAMTSQYDISNSLEKRLKSRFTSVVFQVPSIPTLGGIIETLDERLKLPDTFQDEEFRDQWNDSITEILTDQQVLKQLERPFLVHNNPLPFLNIFNTAMSYLCEEKQFLESSMVLKAIQEEVGLYFEKKLMGISESDFLILGVVAKMTEKRKAGEFIVFDDFYDEYSQFSSSHFKASSTLPKAQASSLIKGLINIGMLKSDKERSVHKFKLNIDSRQIEECARDRVDLPTNIKQYIGKWLE
ncbi:hypothetical protein CYY_008480 [Polysphondylium violaceum]|uniref:Origin recognition complex subunit 4 n=1 Tax=Polysphondylium violaceum TaxID=133409 RepID=A0A8J4PQD2_9MYCE|nr:hypothetical protein CYY_008480 [Polysphondylium violaceum]